MLRKIGFFSWFIFILSGCLRQTNEGHLAISLQQVDSIKIPVNAETNIQSGIKLVRYNGGEWLSCYQLKDGYNRFHWYSLDSLAYYKTFEFSIHGPDGVGKLSAVIDLVSFDSMLVHPVNTNRFFLVDSSGYVHLKIDLTHHEEGSIQSPHYFPPEIVGNKLYFFRISPLPFYTADYLKNTKIQGCYNLVTQSYSIDNIGYPSYPNRFELSSESWKVSRCIGRDGEMVFSFPFDPALYVWNGSQLARKELPNNDQPHDKPVTLSDVGSMEQQMAFIASTGLYTYVMYDPFNHYYYRIYLLPQIPRQPDGNLKRVADFAWKLEIIDDQFRLVGKAYFEAGKYNPYQVMVSKRGILVSRNNAYQPQQEDYLWYDVYKPAGLPIP
jgi:hypothetical protein